MKKATYLFLAVIFGCLIILVGCRAEQGEGFAIYLTRDNVPPDKMAALSHIDIQPSPIISIEDIITYNAQTHEIKLTDKAFARITQLEVPVQGKSFVVCVDGAPIYWGAFWTPISSISFGGVTIWKPLGSQEPKVITLELGYPSSSFYNGEDPRSNPVIMKSIQQSGKLINKLSITDIDLLPRSMKGYELYSWLENNQWYFRLITGTNRNKTIEEITQQEDFISETGWVSVRVAGIDALKEALSRLPQNESVFWSGGMHISQPNQSGIQLGVPPADMRNEITQYADLQGLDFTVPFD